MYILNSFFVFFFLRYEKQAKKVSEIYHDQPMTPMEKAVYWVEYIARHRGAPHLHSAAQDMSLITLYNIDVYALFLVTFVFVVAVLKNIFQALFSSKAKSTEKLKLS